jgi:hypothetical protein
MRGDFVDAVLKLVCKRWRPALCYIVFTVETIGMGDLNSRFAGSAAAKGGILGENHGQYW